MVKINVISIKGARSQNEDKHNVIKNITGLDKTLNNINYYGIYDGHGGKFVSTFLSTHFPKFFMDKRVVYPLKKNNLYKVCSFFQETLKTQYLKQATEQGSTCLVCIQYIYNGNNYLNILNIGDCRCVICHNNIAIPLTKDHKPDKPEEEQRIKNLGGTIYFDGHDWRIDDLSVSRSFGDLSSEKYISCKPDVFEYLITSNDKFMVMACDGLWDVMENQEVIDFILKNKNSQNLLNKLTDHALQKGSTDNISVIVVFFHEN